MKVVKTTSSASWNNLTTSRNPADVLFPSCDRKIQVPVWPGANYIAIQQIRVHPKFIYKAAKSTAPAMVDLPLPDKPVNQQDGRWCPSNLASLSTSN